ncbi:MAG: hypothetical protein LBF57_01470, partial [Holosporaceae bacterium]|nr:hypothetical protein [Holosporaceae bacterium]
MKGIIDLRGALCTGASAVGDYLKGSPELFSWGENEFDLVRDSGGLWELYHLLYSCYITRSSALTRFRSYLKYYKNIFAGITQALKVPDPNVADRFWEISEEFIEQLTKGRVNYEYVGNRAFADDVLLNYLQETTPGGKILNFLRRIVYEKNLNIPIKTHRPVIESLVPKDMPKEDFINLSRKYIDDVISLVSP